DGFRFRPGQFAWLTTGKTPLKITGHPFSFSSSAAVSDGQVEMTIRNLGDFTSKIGHIPVGQRVYLDGPYGAFTIDRNPADMHVLIAGGVGITPMMSANWAFQCRNIIPNDTVLSREATMRRSLADWLALGTALVVIAMSLLFAVLRTSGLH